VRGQGAFIIVAVRQFDGRVIAHPDHSTILQQGDTVILLGHRGDVPNFARRYACVEKCAIGGLLGRIFNQNKV